MPLPRVKSRRLGLLFGVSTPPVWTGIVLRENAPGKCRCPSVNDRLEAAGALRWYGRIVPVGDNERIWARGDVEFRGRPRFRTGADAMCVNAGSSSVSRHEAGTRLGGKSLVPVWL